MEGLDIPCIATGGAIVLIILIFAVIGFMKGMIRMFFGLLAFTAGALIAYWGFQRGGTIAGYVISGADPWMSGAVGVILGLAVIFTARAIFGMVVKPTKVQEGKKQNMPAMGAVLGLILGLLLSWFSLSSIRYVGTLTDLQWVQNCLAEEGKITKVDKPALVKLRDLVDGTIPGQFHKEYDPLNHPVRAEIAKLRILTEHPYAITQVSVNNGVRRAFRQTDIRNFLENSQGLTAFIKESNFSHLLEADSVRNLSELPAAREALIGVNITSALGVEPVVEKTPKKEKKKEPEQPLDPNAPKPGSARIF